jgi:outer membrane protein assembly factor BamB
MLGGVLWRTQTGGTVRSTPTIAGGIVLVGSSDQSFYALDADTGHEKWRFPAGSAVSSSAATADGRVYFSTYKGTFYALSFSDGTLLWKAQFGPDAPRVYEHETGPYPARQDREFILSSATISNATVVVGGGDGFLYAFDAASGRLRWKFQTGGRVRSSPAIHNGVVYVGSYDGSVYAVHLDSGKPLWRYDTKGRSLNSADFGFDRKSILSSPAVSDGVVYVGSRDAHLYAIDAAQGTLRWAHDYENDNMSWVISSPAVRDHVVYVAAAGGEFVHALDAADGREIWRLKMPGLVWSSPVIVGSQLYITCQSGALYAVSLSTGKATWQFQTRSSVQSSPVAANGVVYFGGDDGGIYAIRADATQPIQRAVYQDQAAVRLWAETDLGITEKDEAVFNDFFRARGYDVIGSSVLQDWLTRRISDHAPSVVVFSFCQLPTEVLGSDPAHGLFRRYLEAGGKVVWVGFPPELANLQTDKDNGVLLSVDWERASQLLGLPYEGALLEAMSNNLATPAGREWGLPEWWLAKTWAVPVSNDMVALSLDDRGFAGAWLRNYGGAIGTGFVAVGLTKWDDDSLNRLAMVAEYRPREE